MNKFLTKIAGVVASLAMVIGVGVGVASKQAKGIYADSATASFAPADFSGQGTSGTGSDISATVNGVTFACNKGYGTTQIRCYKDGKITISSSYTLTDITFAFSGSYTGGLETSYTSLSSTSWEKTLSSQARITECTVTYSTGGQQTPKLGAPSPVYDEETNRVTWADVANANSYQVSVGDEEHYETATSPYDGNFQVGEAYTVYVKAISNNHENYLDSDAGSVEFTVPTPFEGKDYVPCSSSADLIAGEKYIITSGTSGSIKAMSTESNTNNRRQIGVTVANNGRLTTTAYVLVLELGGSNNAWTFKTTNYLGTNGYFESASSGTSNNLLVNAHASENDIPDNGKFTITFNNGIPTIHANAGNRTYMRHNAGSSLFSLYQTNNGNGQNDVYLWKEYKQLTSLNVTGTPTKLTGYYDTESFDPTGITAYEAVYEDNSTKALSASDIEWPALTAGMTTIRGSYEEGGDTVYTPTYNITVLENTYSVVISGSMETSYYITDEDWNKGNLVVTLSYLNGDQTVVTNDSTFAYYTDSAMTNPVASPAALGEGEDQTIYVKATYQEASNATGYAQIVSVTIEHGTLQNDPLTVAEAVTIGNQLAHNNQTQKQYYIQGVVTQIDENTFGEQSNYATFWLQNGGTSLGFEAYRITRAAGCDNYTDLKVGAEVLIKCQIKKYSDTIETGTNKSLISITYVAPTLTGITLDETEVYLGVGEDITLSVSPTPVGAELGTVTWESSEPSVATVNQEGEVIAVAVGTSTITARAGGFEATCVINVSLKATMKYVSDTTTNMGNGNNAGLVNLDENLFSVVADKGGNNNFPGLNRDDEIRMYSGNSITVKISSQYTIETIVVEYLACATSASVYAGSSETPVSANAQAAYTINNQSFRIAVSGNTVKIASIAIIYRDATAAEKTNRLDTRNTLSYGSYTNQGDDTFTYTDVAIRFGGLISKALWDELDTNEHLIQGYGVMISYEDLGGNTFESYYNDSKAGNTVEQTVDFMFDNDGLSGDQDDGLIHGKDYYFPLTNEKTHPAEAIDSQKAGEPAGTYYVWNLYKKVSMSNLTKDYTAVAYIRVGNELVFLQQTTASAQSLAHDLISSGAYANDAFEGSLAYLAGL